MVFGERGRGYLEALKEAGLEHSSDLVIEEALDTGTGAMVVDKILGMDPRPDAIFAGIDMSAASLMYELKSRGVRIPEDMAIAGFNNSDLSRMMEPQLTTVHYPSKEMGRMAALSLMEMLDTRNQVATQNIVLKHELKIRPSTLKKRH
jgi:LacI family transcriptional regulator